ncbi:MAG TPA: hypothetical protein PLK99_09575 [Burkholderiales bacterium]|nr:hypothetical protein [Burkholderiales bacterium]
MLQDLMANQKFMQASKEAALKALKGKVLQGKIKEDEMKHFLDAIGKEGVPAPIGATASLVFALFYGVVKCEPREQPWIYDEDVWGIGGAAISSVGFMYTAYDNWNAFFTNTTAFHVQGIAEAGGIYQINWFNSSGTPIGQFNGAAGGIAIFEAGGSGKWKKK